MKSGRTFWAAWKHFFFPSHWLMVAGLEFSNDCKLKNSLLCLVDESRQARILSGACVTVFSQSHIWLDSLLLVIILVHLFIEKLNLNMYFNCLLTHPPRVMRFHQFIRDLTANRSPFLSYHITGRRVLLRLTEINKQPAYDVSEWSWRDDRVSTLSHTRRVQGRYNHTPTLRVESSFKRSGMTRHIDLPFFHDSDSILP